MSTETKWFVTDQLFDRGGKVIAGPFSSFNDAIEARRAMENLTSQSFYIDHRDPDPFTPGSVWYAKETFTVRTGHAIKRGKRVAVTVPRYSADLQPGEVAGVVGTALGVNYLPKAMLVAERPEPLVVLPETPTLGWLSVSDDGSKDRKPATVLGIWRSNPRFVSGVADGMWSHEYVTAFTEAIAVPKAEYELFVDALDRGDLLGLERAAEALRDAVDAAGEGK